MATRVTRNDFVPRGRRVIVTAPLQNGANDLSQDNPLSIAVATASAAGSMSAADKAKLDAATAAATVSTVVMRDASGDAAFHNVTAVGFLGPLTGNVTGNVSGSAGSFTGSLAGDVTGTQAATVVSLVGGSSAANVHAAELLANAATSANTASTLVKRDGSSNAAVNVLSAAQVTGLNAPLNGSDAANKIYVDNAIAGLSAHPSCRVATTANVASLSTLLTIDGVTLLAGDRVLVKNQTTASQNGLYLAATGAWTRAADLPVGSESTPGIFVFIGAGTVNGGNGWVITNAVPYVVGTDSLTFTQVSASTSYTAGAGLTLTGNMFSVTTGTYLAIANNLSDLASAATARTNLGLGSAATHPATDFDASGAAATVQTNLNTHTADHTNPHVVTATQVGLGNVLNSVQLVAASNLADLASAATARANLGLGSAATHAATEFANALVPTSVKTTNYAAAANDFVPVDTTSGSVIVTLPTAPADKTRIGIKHVIQGGANTVIFNCGGTDVFNKAGGLTTGTLSLVSQAVQLQYAAGTGIWYVVADDLPLSQLDLRYAAITPVVQTIAYAATVTPVGSNGWSVANVGTLTGNITIAAPSGTPVDGNQLTLRLVQDATGGRTITWNAAFALGTDVTTALIPTTASAKFEMKFVYNATDSKWRAVAIARGF